MRKARRGDAPSVDLNKFLKGQTSRGEAVTDESVSRDNLRFQKVAACQTALLFHSNS